MKQYFFNTRQQLNDQLENFGDSVEIGEKLKALMTDGKRLERALKQEKRLILSIHGGVVHVNRIPDLGLEPVYLYE